jgi:hypothetical protein
MHALSGGKRHGEGGGTGALQTDCPVYTKRLAPHLTKFLLRMRGAFTDAATIVLPVMKIPHAAPTMHSVKASAEPKLAKKKGFTLLNTELQSLLVAERDISN